jgi:hypothetical protein
VFLKFLFIFGFAASSKLEATPKPNTMLSICFLLFSLFPNSQDRTVPKVNSEEWIPLTRSMIKKIGKAAWEDLEQQGHSGRTLSSLFWAEMGTVFEEAVLQSLGMDSNSETFNGTVPDAVGRILNGKLWQGWPKAIFVEVKISTLIPVRERDRLQILRMIEYLRQVTERADVTPALILVTPADAFIKEEIINAATQAKVSLLHAEVQANRLNHKVIRVGPAKPINQSARGVAFLQILRNSCGRPAGLDL